MKSIKILGLAALTVLALTAFSGVASATGFSYGNINGEGNEFHSELYPAAISGEQIPAEMPNGETIKKITLETAAGKVKCTNSGFTSSVWAPEGLKFDTSELLLGPTFGECSLSGIGATITKVLPECSDTFSITEGNRFFYMCELKITEYNCTITFPHFIHSNNVGYTNVGSGSTSTISVRLNITGIEYQIAGGCPNEAKEGTHTDGGYKGGISLSAKKL